MTAAGARGFEDATHKIGDNGVLTVTEESREQLTYSPSHWQVIQETVEASPLAKRIH